MGMGSYKRIRADSTRDGRVCTLAYANRDSELDRNENHKRKDRVTEPNNTQTMQNYHRVGGLVFSWGMAGFILVDYCGRGHNISEI